MTILDDFINDLDYQDSTFDADEWERWSTLDDDGE